MVYGWHLAMTLLKKTIKICEVFKTNENIIRLIDVFHSSTLPQIAPYSDGINTFRYVNDVIKILTMVDY